jgi:hexokinase
VERNKNITKKKDLDPTKSQIVNVESGGFARAPRGSIDRQFDESSVSPGTYTFEKMISGAYLGPLCLRTIHVAAEDGLFPNLIAKALKKIEQISTEAISDFMYHPTRLGVASRSQKGDGNPLSPALNGGREEDLITLYYLIDRLIERAAKLTAINLSSVVIKSGKGTNPCFPICIVAEGTTFYRLKSLQPRVEYYMKAYLENQKNLYYEIVDIENATLIGAAIAGLTN